MHRKRITGLAVCAAALAATLSASTAMAAPSTSAESGAAAATQAAPAARTLVVRALTPAEIQARGLSRYVPAGSSATAKAGATRTAAPSPKRAKASSVQLRAGGCWTANIKQPGWLGMDGYGSEDWCGNGSSITYAAAACWGTDGWYPTYNYLGCTKSKYYGVGWNVADTQYNWDMCIAWWGGGCAKHRHLWDRYRFGAGGGLWLISHGG